ncbi:MAG: hypothetical protein ACXAAO_14945 [Candidatus Thorarchaeota archaeon]|jgi:hypothetical protein
MKTKLFVEPKGKAREEVILYSCIPLKWKSFQKWQKVWISNKEYKKWGKTVWDSGVLGEVRPGKIVRATMDDKNLKGSLIAYRSFYPDISGKKTKLPMVLFARVKKNLDLKEAVDRMKLSEEQTKELKQSLKQDAWAPFAVWHPQPVDRNQDVTPTDVFDHATNYAKALFTANPKSSGWSSFIETERFT